MIFHLKSYSDRRNRGRNGCQSFLVKVIFLLASRLLASTTLIYLCVVVILLCAMMLCMVRMSVPAAACSVANVLRYEWNVMFLVISAERIHSFIGICVQLRIRPLNTKPFFSELYPINPNASSLIGMISSALFFCVMICTHFPPAE